MATNDFRINASVHHALVRFWIDTARLEFGTTNGVVYLRGTLRRLTFKTQTTTRGPSDQEEEKEATFLIRRVDGELKNIPGVRDVVYDLGNLRRVGGRWIHREAS